MFKVQNLLIPKDEVLRYLGYRAQNIDKTMDELIETAIEECKKLITPKYIYSYNNILKEDEGIAVQGTKLVLPGEDIKDHLKDSTVIVLMAVTLGGAIEKRIAFYEKLNLTKALILDACATTAVEEICDNIEGYIKDKAKDEGLGITFRFSPGYGDLTLEVQKDIIDTLKADKNMGLTVSSHNLLMPRKSVTAIIGLIPKNKEKKEKGCAVCKNYENCTYRREGHTCGI